VAHGSMAVYRVHWLKAKSRRDRWQEEEILLASEMEWTELFFRHRASRWKTLAAETSAIASHNANSSQLQGATTHSISEFRHSKGHVCYALKLENMWKRLAQQAAVQFNKVPLVIKRLAPIVVPYSGTHLKAFPVSSFILHLRKFGASAY
jgi:hypothetical protein